LTVFASTGYKTTTREQVAYFGEMEEMKHLYENKNKISFNKVPPKIVALNFKLYLLKTCDITDAY
jgi:hypothetical protein